MVIMIILLILCLPLILMLSLFTTTNVVSIVVDVPVTGIEISVEDVIELDLDKGESFVVDYIVTPTEASKKDVKFLFLPVGNEKLASFTQEGNRIIPTSYGTAMVTVETLDGGFRDAFQIVVHSKMVESIDSKPEKDTIVVGESTNINTVYYPENASDRVLSYRVKDGEDIVSVSGGKIQGIGIGTAVIEVTSLVNPEAKSEFTINVVSSGVIDLVETTRYLTSLDLSAPGTISSIINPDISVSDYEIKLLDKNGLPLADSIVDISFDPLTGLISYDFINEAFVGDIEIKLTVTPENGAPVTKSCFISCISEISVDWKDQKSDGKYVVSESEGSGEKDIGIDLRPLGADVSYYVTLTYKEATGEEGNVKSGVEFELIEGEVYVCDKGYISLQLNSSIQGVNLNVKQKYVPKDINDIGSTATYISLKIVDNNNGKFTILDEILVMVF